MAALNDLSWGTSSFYFPTQSQSRGAGDLVNTESHTKTRSHAKQTSQMQICFFFKPNTRMELILQKHRICLTACIQKKNRLTPSCFSLRLSVALPDDKSGQLPARITKVFNFKHALTIFRRGSINLVHPPPTVYAARWYSIRPHMQPISL